MELLLNSCYRVGEVEKTMTRWQTDLMKLTLFLFWLFAALWALAHSGGLDSNGGHTDRTTGIYHFHRSSNPLSGNTTNVSLVARVENRAETKTETVESNQREGGAFSTLTKLPVWIYLLVLACGYAMWETSTYFCRNRQPNE